MIPRPAVRFAYGKRIAGNRIDFDRPPVRSGGSSRVLKNIDRIFAMQRASWLHPK